MACFDEHCQDCIKKLGKPFEEVHRWLDEFAAQSRGDFSHRDLRHHLEGVEEVRRRWGDQAAEAAVLHILLDWRHLFIENELPKNQSEAAIFRDKACQIIWANQCKSKSAPI
jgi:DNA-binding GntR family transcriptional regulator